MGRLLRLWCGNTLKLQGIKDKFKFKRLKWLRMWEISRTGSFMSKNQRNIKKGFVYRLNKAKMILLIFSFKNQKETIS